MTTYCEISECLIRASSSCPATDVVVLSAGVGRGRSVTISGLQPESVVLSSARAGSSTAGDRYTLLGSSLVATSSVVASSDIDDLLTSSARARSVVVQALVQMCVSSAEARGGDVLLSTPHELVSVGSGVSSVVVSTQARATMASRLTARGSVLPLGLLETALGAGRGVSSAYVRRDVECLTLSRGLASSDASPAGDIDPQVYVASASASSMCLSSAAMSVYTGSSGVGASRVFYRDPEAKAVVLNTENTAVSWYDNYGFESIASMNGRTLAAGYDGIYELAGDDDEGELINARVVSGFTDFGTEKTKRLDNMYFGYTSDGQLEVQAEVYESGSPPTAYLLEPRNAYAPRNSRVTPGKGLWGRFWRLTTRNVHGSDFEVRSASVDIAISARRV